MKEHPPCGTRPLQESRLSWCGYFLVSETEQTTTSVHQSKSAHCSSATLPRYHACTSPFLAPLATPLTDSLRCNDRSRHERCMLKHFHSCFATARDLERLRMARVGRPRAAEPQKWHLVMLIGANVTLHGTIRGSTGLRAPAATWLTR